MSVITAAKNFNRASIPMITTSSPTENKTLDFAKNLFKSPTFWIILLSLGISIFTPIAYHLALPSEAILTIDGFALAIMVDLGIYFKKKFIYEVSFLDTLIHNKLTPNKWSWYSKLDDNIILGAMPLKNRNHINELIQLAGKDKLAILSILEEWEMKEQTPFTNPATAEDWKNNHISQSTIEAEDYIPLTLDQIKKAVEFIKTQVAKGKKVYVHCKAGRGRSAIAVACYYMQKNHWTPEEAIRFIEEKRPNVTLFKKPKYKRIQEFYDKFVK